MNLLITIFNTTRIPLLNTILEQKVVQSNDQKHRLLNQTVCVGISFPLLSGTVIMNKAVKK